MSKGASEAKRSTPPRWYRRINAPFWAALAATLLCVLFYLGHRSHTLPLPGVEEWEDRVSDVRFRMRGTQKRLDDRVVIVAYDDATRRGDAELWQTRRGFAKLLDKIRESKPRAVGIDAFFSSPEINLSAATVAAVEEAQRTLLAEANTSEEPLSNALLAAQSALEEVSKETRGDQLLALAVEKDPALVLAGFFYLDGDPAPVGSREPAGYSKGRFDEAVYLQQPAGKSAPQAKSAVSPLEVISEVISHMGHVNVKHDNDGAVRQVPMVIEHAGLYYQSLSLKLASMELGAPTSYVAGDDFVTLGERRVPLTAEGFARVNYLGGNDTFARISAIELMEHKGPHKALEDRIVLVGYTDTVRDKIIVPFEQQYDGVALHATLIHNMLHDQIIKRASITQSTLAIVLLGFLLSLTQIRRVRKRGAGIVGVAALFCLASYAIVGQLVFNRYQVQLVLVVPSLSIVFITLTALTVSLATEGREKAQIRAAFGKYLQSNLIEKILQDPERLKLGGQRRELTVLFSDIRSFSRFSEKLEPDVLSDFLNEYLTPMTDIVLGHSGMLDKYIGDAVMAVYGAPVPFEDHAERACRSALLMIENLGPMNEVWKADDLPEIKIGIGINTGTMSVGNMGSEAHFDYTVMGDAVNLGARLESLTKAYGVTILVGEATQKDARSAFAFREIDSVRVVGRSAAARVFELCGSKSDSPFSEADLAAYQEALDAYRDADWDTALDRFDAFLSSHPGDGPAATMIERIAQLKTEDLGPDWDGVYEQRGK